MKRKEVLRILEKIKWEGKLAKLPKLTKLLKSILSGSKCDPNVVSNYLVLESATFKYIYMLHDSKDDVCLSTCDLEAVKKLWDSYYPITTVSNAYIDEILRVDIKCLSIVLHFMGHDYGTLIAEFVQLNNEFDFKQFSAPTYPKYTLKLAAECCLYYTIACLHEGTLDKVDESLSLFCFETFENLCSANSSSASSAGSKKPTNGGHHSFYRYLIIALKLHLAVIFTGVEGVSGPLQYESALRLIQRVAKLGPMEPALNERFVRVPLLATMVQLLLRCWSDVCAMSVTTTSCNDAKMPASCFKNQCEAISFIATSSLHIVNFLGKGYLYNPDFSRSNILPTVDVFTAIMAILYTKHHSSDSLLSTVCFTAMNCGYKNPFIHLVFACSLLHDGFYSTAQNTLEALSDIYQTTLEDGQLPSSHQLMLLSNYINRTYQVDRGLDLAKSMLTNGDTLQPPPVCALAHLAYALCCLTKVQHSNYYCWEDKKLRDTLLTSALEQLDKAHSLDPYNGEVVLYIAYTYACLDKTNVAYEHAQNAATLLLDDVRPRQLLVLLLTSMKMYQEAEILLKKLLNQFSTNLNLMYLRVKLAKYVGTHVDQLYKEYSDMTKIVDSHIAKKIKSVWGNFCSSRKDTPLVVEPLLKIAHNTSIELFTYPRAIFGSPKEGDQKKRVEKKCFATSSGGLSMTKNNQTAESLNNAIYDMSIQYTHYREHYACMRSHILAEMWDLMLSTDNNMDKLVYSAIKHEVANNIASYNPLTVYIKELDPLRNVADYTDTSTEFKECLARHPTHLKLLIAYFNVLKKRLASINAQLRKVEESDEKKLEEEKNQLLLTMEQYATTITHISPDDFKSWQLLGETLMHRKKYDKAAEVLSKALDIEKTQPIVSFFTLPIIFCSSDV